MRNLTAIASVQPVALSFFMEASRPLSLYPRRWAAVAAYLLLIYASLPLTPMITGAVLRRIGKAGFEEAVWIGLGFLAVGLAYWLTRVEPHHRFKAALVLAGVGVAAWFTSNPSEQFHLGIYAVLGYLVYRASGQPRAMRPLLIAFAAVVLAGTLDEVIQAILPNRYWDVKDIGRNVVGGAMGLFIAPFMRRSE